LEPAPPRLPPQQGPKLTQRVPILSPNLPRASLATHCPPKQQEAGGRGGVGWDRCLYGKTKYHPQQHQPHPSIRPTQEQVRTSHHTHHRPPEDTAPLPGGKLHSSALLCLPELPKGQDRYPRQQKDTHPSLQQPGPALGHLHPRGTALLQSRMPGSHRALPPLCSRTDYSQLAQAEGDQQEGPPVCPATSAAVHEEYSGLANFISVIYISPFPHMPQCSNLGTVRDKKAFGSMNPTVFLRFQMGEFKMALNYL
jgi:hypothetical protein